MRDSTRVALLAVALLHVTGLNACLELEPPSVVVPYGAPAVVQCRALEDVEFMGVESRNGGVPRIKSQNVTWRVDNLTIVDFKVLCYATATGKKPCQRTIPITVYKFPENVTIVDDKEGLDEGVPHVFRCDVTDAAPVQNMTVTWYIGNRTAAIISGFNEAKDEQVTLSYVPRREDNGLHVRCEMRFDLGDLGPKENRSSQEHPLRIRYPPKNIGHLEDTELELGSFSQLSCVSDGNPPLEYSWDFYKTGNVKVMAANGGSRLVIENATDVNIGNYTCNAVNTLKNISKTVRVTVKGANSQCPIQITPERLVLPYGNQTSVTCAHSTEDASRNMIDIHWRVGQDSLAGAQWDVKKDTDWDPRAECIATFSGIGQCRKSFDVTFYKTADEVLIHSVGPMVAGRWYQLRCDFVNVAPVLNLTVRWYQDDDVIDGNGSFQVTGCPHQNTTDCDLNLIRSPVNVTSTARVVLRRRGQQTARFRCEARLDLGQQQPPPMTSRSLDVSVHYEPIINSTKLPSSVRVFKGESEELVCEADGRPAPKIHWLSEKGVHVSGGNLTVTEAGVWTCSATNAVGSSIRVVTVAVAFKEAADDVLIHSRSHTGPMVVDTEYQLQCDILNVAVVQNLTVRWFQDDDVIEDPGSFQVTGCPHQNTADCDINKIRSPVNVTSTTRVVLRRKGQQTARFRCEARLDLGQQQPPPVMSRSIDVSVHYKPIINSTKLPSSIPVLKGHPGDLVCEADGRPAPTIHWFSEKGVHVFGGNLTVKEAGVWTCNATNVVGYSFHVVEVVLKEDYLPLIAGLVAVTVIVISAVFIVFYSIYYKNTKMRRYSLKNPKHSTQNGNVAHNSWELPLPMTKLS